MIACNDARSTLLPFQPHVPFTNQPCVGGPPRQRQHRRPHSLAPFLLGDLSMAPPPGLPTVQVGLGRPDVCVCVCVLPCRGHSQSGSRVRLRARLALAVDSHIFFANIRPDYLWGPRPPPRGRAPVAASFLAVLSCCVRGSGGRAWCQGTRKVLRSCVLVRISAALSYSVSQRDARCRSFGPPAVVSGNL